MTRSFLRSVSRLLIGVVMLAQMAVSAYACPGLAVRTMQMASAVADDQAGVSDDDAAQTMTDFAGMAGGMDSSFPNLCAEHCHQGEQSDQAPTLTVPAVLLSALYVTAFALEPTATPRPAADATSALVAASPPHTILHCCFRI